jgi:preprotein translocase subunit SecG
MFTILLTLHVIISLILIGLVLLQPGEGRGLSETFGGGMAESLLGSKASNFLTKATAVFATLFFVVSISLTALTARSTKSVFEKADIPQSQTQAQDEAASAAPEANAPAPLTADEVPAQ